MNASILYGVAGWRLGLAATRFLPPAACQGLARSIAWAYAGANPSRLRVVQQNLLHVLHGDLGRARSVAKRVFDQFGRKLADLWAYEGGRPVEGLMGVHAGLEHLERAKASGRGTVLVTPHLGSWELGGPLLHAHGHRLLVVSMEEPSPALTELRRRNRQRWGIQTVVLGANPFTFVEVLRHLESGGTTALLVDRPAPASAVRVEFLNQPFMASIAAAELARASGCEILPVILPRQGAVYNATVGAPVPYDRRELGRRPAREAFAQEIMRRFEPAIRTHPDQWFHFIPIWPER